MEIRSSPERIVPFSVGAVVGVILASCFWMASMDRPILPVSPRPLHSAARTPLTGSQSERWDSVKIACVVLVTDVTKAYTVANLWGRRCDYIQYYTNSHRVPSFLKVQRLKTKSDWDYFCQIHNHLSMTSPPFEWFLFATDHSYVIIENLRSLLQGIFWKEPHYIGHIVAKNGLLYNTAQATIVMSLGTMNRLSWKFPDAKRCLEMDKIGGAPHDYTLGKVLTSLNIEVEDTRDWFGRDRFHRSSLEKMLYEWSKSISPSTVSFKIEENPHLVEYLLYSTGLVNVSNSKL